MVVELDMRYGNCALDGSPDVILFFAGFILTLLNAHGILLSRKRFIPLHIIGVTVGVLLMGQVALR